MNGDNGRVGCGDERAKGGDKTGQTTRSYGRFVSLHSFRLSPRLPFTQPQPRRSQHKLLCYLGASPLSNLVSHGPPSSIGRRRGSRRARDDVIFILHAIFTFDSIALFYLSNFKVEALASVEKYSARRGVWVESWRSVPI